ncbi:MAG: phosphotransferase, partial [Candidatus Eisenbacteria bacterium]|nr:phosphotransferase [Candidatus Eisenbacteria bacterium]
YSGVALLSQEALRALPAGGFAELTPHLRRWAEAGRLGAHFERAPFRDVGTLESYLEVHRELLRAPDRSRWLADDPPSGASGTVSGPHESFVDPSASIGHGACITASVVLAESSVADGAILDLALLGPGSSASGVCERVAICEGESRPLRLLPTTDEAACLRFLEEHPIPGASTAPERPRLSLLHGDGSRRRIVRVLRADASAILVWNPPMPLPPNYPARTGPGIPDENESFCYVRDHLAGLGIHVPRIDAFDRARGLLLMEDLGSTRLADLPEQRPEEREAAYEQAIDLLVLLQSPAEVSFDPERTFNLAYDSAFVRRYELEYFQREMVEGRAGLPTAEAGLRAEYDAIAQHTQAGSRVLMHRDFQSRNLMVTRRGLALIDFQGARPGPPGYDLASLLWDPYVELGDLRERLLQRYLRRTGRETAEAESFRAELRPVAIARLLQALGAFAFLGGRLGKAGFLEHAPRALDRVIALAEPSYPHLARCAGSVRDALAGR